MKSGWLGPKDFKKQVSSPVFPNDTVLQTLPYEKEI
jgi:hypothetical protein